MFAGFYVMNGYLIVRGSTKDCIQAVKQCPAPQEGTNSGVFTMDHGVVEMSQPVDEGIRNYKCRLGRGSI